MPGEVKVEEAAWVPETFSHDPRLPRRQPDHQGRFHVKNVSHRMRSLSADVS